MLNIVVCVKAVPDPNEACNIKIDPDTKTLMRCDVPMVINPLDKNAIEAALQLKRTQGGEITVLSMGPPPAGQIVKECLALGADHGILLSDPAFGGADAYATAFTLAKGIEKIGTCDLILCGMASSDGATEWVGPQIATFLDLPVVTMVREIIDEAGKDWLVKADWENGYRRVAVQLPVVFTVTRDLNRPKALSFSGIIKARKKEITTWTMADLDTDVKSVGLKGSPTIVGSFGKIDNRRSVQMIAGAAEEKADALVKILAEAGAIG
jgi:electron transfer flavoprotein beta subunit